VADSLTSRILNRLGLQVKAATPAPDLGRQNYIPANYHLSNWGRTLSRTDYRNEVGDLDANSLVMAVVNYTATRIPEAKPSVVKRTKDGDDERDFQHPLAKLIRRPNRHHVWANYAFACSMSWWMSGNVYFYKVRDATDVIELWYLPHFMVSPRWPNDGRSPEVPVENDTDSFLSHYQYDVPGKQPVLYPAKDIVHLKRGVDLGSPRLGLGAFESLFKELYGDDKMALFTASIMSKMGIQVPLISPRDKDVSLSLEDAALMRDTWIAKTTGARAGEPVVMAEPINVEKFGFNPSELDLSNLRLIPESRVAAVTGIPAATLQFMVGLQNGTSYASSEQARQQGYEEVIVPIQQAWAEEFNWQLLPEFEGTAGSEFQFDVSNVRVLEEDKDSLVKREAESLRAGATTINAFLQATGKKPVGLEGDVYLIPGVSTPMTAERLIEAATTPPTVPPIVDPAVQDAAKFADIDRVFARLEDEMRGFVNDAR
jgi:HK97 family phage portal protein